MGILPPGGPLYGAAPNWISADVEHLVEIIYKIIICSKKLYLEKALRPPVADIGDIMEQEDGKILSTEVHLICVTYIMHVSLNEISLISTIYIFV